MLTVFTEKHRLRNVKTELSGGELVPPFECPVRAEHILERAKTVELGNIIAPQEFGLDPIYGIHDKGYVDFLETCWERWVADGNKGDAIPYMWPTRDLRQVIPDHVDGQMGYYSIGADTSISDGTYEAARAAVDVALTAQKAIADGAASAFALCRPPGHHASANQYGGYCFFNNAAIAAQAFLNQGAKRVSILDVDFHHGNGTQQIFYGRDDVQFLSLHGDPMDSYPYFLGHADEQGQGKGGGFTENYPMGPGTAYDKWGAAMDDACRKINVYGPDAIIVSLGVDTFKNDPISFFKLESDDFKRYGARLAQLNRPTLFVMEGGYAVEEIGINAVNVLTGFEGR
ncbi:histone deacetylase family protein [Aestuariispira insulae]|uniref:Acetoin utilization deacetylase AcuC-like enzyme n=1 Tax=Aestuariispira insulae TaxID=1461337 RepID=A0A3D9HWB5_9PROT|nr:histone deacetylase family protein [Aestuariispira insulae]RED53788.1 acetoin utilization deacetylase AcuC-like enzyme [Aestuariispira insulae]